MPSWNVHTAHVQRLLKEGTASSFGIRDVDAFLFGNYVPDVYVGYMLPHPSGILPYALTHFADPCAIPIPREREFWDLYVEPTLEIPANVPIGPAAITVEEGVRISRVYNTATHAWLERFHVPTGEATRIRKQGDFDKFGRTLPITLTCEATSVVLTQAAEFPQYALRERDVRRSVDVARGIVEDNQRNHIDGTPEYSLFTSDFFFEVFEHATELLVERLSDYARRVSA